MIRVEYDKARTAGKRLNAAADACTRASQQMGRLKEEVPVCWQGESARAFTNELGDWNRENQRIQDELRQLSVDIMRVADSFETTEKKLVEASSGASGGGSGSGHGF